MSVSFSRDRDGVGIEWIAHEQRLFIGLELTLWDENPLWWAYLGRGQSPVRGKFGSWMFVRAVLRMALSNRKDDAQ